MASRTRAGAILAAAAILVLGALGWWLLGGEGGGGAPGTAGGGAGAAGPADPERGPAGGGAAAAPPAPAATGTLLAKVRSVSGDAVRAWMEAEPEGEGPAPRLLRAEGPDPVGLRELRLDGVPAGPSFRVLVGAAGFQTKVVPGVVLARDGVRDLGEFVLGRALPVTGRVLDPGGRPVAGARVGALPAAGSPADIDLRDFMDGLFGEAPFVAETTSREDGAFALDSLGEGTWTLVARGEGFAPGRKDGVLLHPSGPARPVDLVLEPAHPLRVTVREGGGEGRPVAGASVLALIGSGRGLFPSAGDRVLASTDAAGTALLAGLPPGSLTLAVRTGDGRIAVRQAEVPRVAELAVDLGGTASLRVLVKDREGRPIPGASVTAALEGGGSGSAQFLRAPTDDAGAVEWKGLAPGRLMLVSAEKAGFAPSSSLGLPFLGGASRERKEVAEGETLEEEVVLGPGATVAGRVTRKADGAAVAGAKVVLVVPSRFLLGATRSTTSGEDGAFLFEGVPEGNALLSAKTETAASPLEPGALFTMEGTAPPGAGSVAVPAGPGEVRLDLVLEEGGTVSGRVTGPDGGPVAGAVVSAQPGGRGDALEVLGAAAFGGSPVLTAADGAFLLRGVAPSERTVLRATAEGFLGGSSSRFRVSAGGAAEGIEIRLARGGSIEGRVTSLDGAPVPGAAVRASGRPEGRVGPDSVPMPGGGSASGFTGADGTFRLQGIGAGTYTLRVDAEGFLQASRRDVSVGEGAAANADFALEAGRVLAGVVRDAGGRPVQGARVTLRPAPGFTPAEGTPRYFNASSDGSGAFRFSSLPEGTWTLTAAADGQPQVTLPSVASGGAPLEVRFEASLVIAGRIAGPGGEPVAGALVRANPEGGGGGGGSARSGPDGSFHIKGMAQGVYTLVATVPGGEFLRAEARGVAAGAEGVLLSLPKALSVQGRVVGPDGGTPGKGFLRATPKGGEGESQGGGWNDDGTFTLQGLAPGRYEIRARTAESPTLQGTVEVEAGAEGVEIRLQAR